MANVKQLAPLMIGLHSTELQPHEINWLTHEAVGGVILFSRNFVDVAQLINLIKQIRTVKSNLLIAVDQEGGRVQRFHGEFTTLPSLGKLGRYYNQAPEQALILAEEVAWLMATELLACGIDISFAPVVDCAHPESAVLNDRTFHTDPQIVCQLGRAYCKGMQTAGMQPVLKHFPGHGGVAADSHTDLPIDERALSCLLQHDLQPFIQLFSVCGAVMAEHVLFPQIDSTYPVGYSSYWLQTILRNQLGFQGAIFSDDLGMAGAATIGEPVVRVQHALAAGCDMVLLCNDPDMINQTLKAISDNEVILPLSNNGLSRFYGEFKQDWHSLQTDRRYQHNKKLLQSLQSQSEIIHSEVSQYVG